MKMQTLETLLTDEFVEFQVDESLLTPIQLRRYEKLLNEGLTRHQIAQDEGVSLRSVTTTFRQIAKKNNLIAFHKDE